ncbi:MAG: pyridoxal phosphate-dependent aminotransferase [Acidobacteriota bacterium]
MKISKRGKEIQASPIRRLVPYSDEAKKRGIKIYHLNIGQPDIPTPRPIIDAIKKYNDEVLSYGPSTGLPELKRQISFYFQRYGIPINEDEVIITVGGSEAILFSFNVVADPGDEIIVPEPFYTNYNGYASMANLKIKPATMKAEDGFRPPKIKDFEKKISKRTRAMLLNSPNNPTGTVYTKEELSEIVTLVKKYDLFLISDEVYKEFIYDGITHTSILEFPDIYDRAIVVDSISKRFSACGARVGAVVSKNQKVIESLTKFAQARLCPQTIEQLGAIAAYKMDPSYFEPIKKEYERRRNLMYEELSNVEKVILKKPQGAFYMIVKLPVKNAEDFAIWLMKDFSIDGESVMVAPGNGFYATPNSGEDEVRIAYVLKEEDLKKALRIFKEGLNKYKEIKEE